MDNVNDGMDYNVVNQWRCIGMHAVLSQHPPVWRRGTLEDGSCNGVLLSRHGRGNHSNCRRMFQEDEFLEVAVPLQILPVTKRGTGENIASLRWPDGGSIECGVCGNTSVSFNSNVQSERQKTEEEIKCSWKGQNWMIAWRARRRAHGRYHKKVVCELRI